MMGATLGAVICVLVALLATSVWLAMVLVAAFFGLYQQLENYVIAPPGCAARSSSARRRYCWPS